MAVQMYISKPIKVLLCYFAIFLNVNVFFLPFKRFCHKLFKLFSLSRIPAHLDHTPSISWSGLIPVSSRESCPLTPQVLGCIPVPVPSLH